MSSLYGRRRGGLTPRTVALAGALAVCAAGAGVAAVHLYGKPTPDTFGCYDSAPQTHSFVLFDASNPRFNEEQERALRTYLDGSYGNLGFNEKLSFITTEGDQVSSIVRPRFYVCGAARTPADLEAINAASATSGYLRKEKDRLYRELYAPELDALLALDPEDGRVQEWQSPILETIQAIARLPEFQPGSRLIIISDLLQYSDSAKFCRVQNEMPPFRVFKQRPVYARLKPKSLAGVAVEVLMLQRQGYGQADLQYCSGEDEIAAFWRDYLIDNGAADPSLIRIRHGSVLR